MVIGLFLIRFYEVNKVSLDVLFKLIHFVHDVYRYIYIPHIFLMNEHT